MEKILDCMGMACPLPVVNAKKAIESFEEDGTLEAISCPADHRNGKVVVISGDTMGSGDEKLGKKLMKAFIYALTSQDVLPDKVICYNRGAFLTTEDPDTVRDLQKLEKEGTVIMTCGTCLDYYGLKEKLQVGIISNMYDIVEALMNASSVIKP